MFRNLNADGHIYTDAKGVFRLRGWGSSVNTTADSRPLPKYLSHKEVRALKIKAVDYVANPRGAGSYLITPAEEGYAPISVSVEWQDRFGAKPGMYYVVYNDGYTSVSPARAFEEGYSAVQE